MACHAFVQLPRRGEAFDHVQVTIERESSLPIQIRGWSYITSEWISRFEHRSEHRYTDVMRTYPNHSARSWYSPNIDSTKVPGLYSQGIQI
jgi:hypothetical protein